MDLRRIWVLGLAEHYLAFVDRAVTLRLELAADDLVMAAWLAYLQVTHAAAARSSDAGSSSEDLAAHLTLRLERLEAMRSAADHLMALPQLGRDLFAPPSPSASAEEQGRMVEAPLFAAPRPLTLRDIAAQIRSAQIRPARSIGALDRLTRHYEGGRSPDAVGQGWAFRTAPDPGHLFVDKVTERRRLFRAATETPAIVAYQQPVTRAGIEDIRGATLHCGMPDRLLDFGCIRFGARRDSPGRPVTFVTTDAFLDHFALETARDLADLWAAGIRGTPDAGGD